jgi:hypothetical protein
VTAIPQDQAREMFFTMLAGGAADGELIELRKFAGRDRTPRGSRFVVARAPARAAAIAGRLAASHEVYAGAAPRTREQGTADAVRAAWVLFADLDDPHAAAGLDTGAPVPPTMVIRTGGITNGVPHLLALWALTEALQPRHFELAQRRLAQHLGADMAATDTARIIRVPGTTSWKRDRAPVTCTHLDIAAAYTARDVVGQLPDPITTRPAPAGVRSSWGPARDPDDPLLAIPASEYVPLLTGRELNRDGKTQCPWHGDGQERTPSLHAYTDPTRGWHCYGCDVGGSIIDFGARLWGITPRGAGYHDVRRRLAVALHAHALDLVA